MDGILHIHSMYSMHDSVSDPKDIVKRAKEMNIKNITLTDHGTLMGIVPFLNAGLECDINTIPGIEAYIENRRHLIIIAKNNEGFLAIANANKEAKIEEFRGTNVSIITDELLEKYFKDNDNVIVTTACVTGPVCSLLRTNLKIEQQNSKYENVIKELAPKYEKWVKINDIYKSLSEEIKSLKKERTSNSKYLKDTFIKKVHDGKADINIYKEALKKDNKLNEIITLKTNKKNTYKKLLTDLKKDKEKYLQAKGKITELVPEIQILNDAEKELLKLKNMFPNFYVEIQYHGLYMEEYAMVKIAELARKNNIPLIAGQDAHMITKEDVEARRLVHFNYFHRASEISDSDRELYMKTETEFREFLNKIFPQDMVDEAIANLSILNKCHVTFDNGKHYPEITDTSEFYSLLKEKRQEMIDNNLWNETYENRLNKEVDIISSMGYISYHLIVKDFCEMGRLLAMVDKKDLSTIQEDILLDKENLKHYLKENDLSIGSGIGPGRGSACGSLVCYMLGITEIDPIENDLLFERFLNPSRVSMPDIDTDVATSIRPYLIKYIKNKYGNEAVCSIATKIFYGLKNAIRLAGRDRASILYDNLKIKGTEKTSLKQKYTKTIVDEILSQVEILLKNGMSDNDIFDKLLDDNAESEEICICVNSAKLVYGKLSGLGVHAGGVIISDGTPVCNYVPTYYNPEKDVMVCSCDMIEAENHGLLKMDLLGLINLDYIGTAKKLIKKIYGKTITKMPFEREVFDNIFKKGDTDQVFQFESAGMKSMLREFKPDTFDDLVLLVAAYRPGPMQYIPDIIEIKNKRKSKDTKIPAMESILTNTYGKIIYQEQVMQIFQTLAGYSLGDADLVRRAMSKKKVEKLEIERKAFIYGDEERGIKGCIANDISETIANELFDEIMEFSKYAFNKSHAAAYAYLSYQTAWLKYHYPVIWGVALLNNKDQDKLFPVYDDLMRHGIEILPPDINKSNFDFGIEEANGNLAIRYGFRGIKGIGLEKRELFEDIAKIRKEDKFISEDDFYTRVKPQNSFLDILSKSGCLKSLGVETTAQNELEYLSFIPRKRDNIKANNKTEGTYDVVGMIISCEYLVSKKGNRMAKLIIETNDGFETGFAMESVYYKTPIVLFEQKLFTITKTSETCFIKTIKNPKRKKIRYQKNDITDNDGVYTRIITYKNGRPVIIEKSELPTT